MALHYYFLLIDPVMDSPPRVGFSVYWMGTFYWLVKCWVISRNTS